MTDAALGWWFESERFRDVAKEDAVNSGRNAEALARFLVARLEERSWEVVDCFSEDWGWLIELRVEQSVLRIACGSEDGSTLRWHVGPLTRPSVWRRMLRRAPSPGLLQRVDHDLRAILEADPTTTWIGREQPEDPPPDATSAR